VQTTLANTYWKLVELHGDPIVTKPDRRETHLILRLDGFSVGGFGRCSWLSGRYRAGERNLTFSDVAPDATECDDDPDEREFIAMLVRVTHYRSLGESLIVYDSSGPLARFRAVYLR
jgi:heat shock protein HslJ